jgi:hypothetical protein
MSDLTALQIPQQFNLVDYTNFSQLNSDAEDRAVIGGNPTGGTDFYNSPSGGSSAFPAPTVYGNVNPSIHVNNGGDAYVGGIGGGNTTFNGGGSPVSSVPTTIGGFESTRTRWIRNSRRWPRTAASIPATPTTFNSTDQVDPPIYSVFPQVPLGWHAESASPPQWREHDHRERDRWGQREPDSEFRRHRAVAQHHLEFR